MQNIIKKQRKKEFYRMFIENEERIKKSDNQKESDNAK